MILWRMSLAPRSKHPSIPVSKVGLLRSNSIQAKCLTERRKEEYEKWSVLFSFPLPRCLLNLQIEYERLEVCVIVGEEKEANVA